MLGSDAATLNKTVSKLSILQRWTPFTFIPCGSMTG